MLYMHAKKCTLSRKDLYHLAGVLTGMPRSPGLAFRTGCDRGWNVLLKPILCMKERDVATAMSKHINIVANSGYFARLQQ